MRCINVNVFFFQAEDGIRDKLVTGVQTCALPISFRSPLIDLHQLGSLYGDRDGDILRTVKLLPIPFADEPGHTLLEILNRRRSITHYCLPSHFQAPDGCGSPVRKPHTPTMGIRKKQPWRLHDPPSQTSRPSLDPSLWVKVGGGALGN